MNSIRPIPQRLSRRSALWTAALILWLVGGWTHAAPEGETRLPPIGSLPVDAGTLLTADGDEWVALPVGKTEVELTVTGMLVHGKLTQQFYNRSARTLDTVYVFPLPERAAVHAMQLRIGDRVIRSIVQEKEEARKTYEAARAAGKKAALVEQQRPNLFSIAAANVNAGETVEVELEYIEEVGYRDGEFRLRFPLSFTPRFTPSGSQPVSAPPVGNVPQAAIRVRLQLGLEAELIESDSHRVSVSGGSSEYRIASETGFVTADRDFHLRWRPKNSNETQVATFVESRNGERYAMVMMVPPQPKAEAGWGLPTETMFVIDVSSSMAGPSIAQARIALERALLRLRPEDRFNMIAFNDGHRMYQPESVQADSDRVHHAVQWVRQLQATGGTMIQPALMAGIRSLEAASTGHQPRMIFLTDGAVSNERQVLRSVVDALGDIRLHTLAIGAAPNNYLIRKMAEQGRGHSEFIFDTNRVEQRLDRFLERIDRPVLTDLQVSWRGADPLEIYPSPLPDLYPGEPVFLAAKLRGSGHEPLDGEIELRGYTREGDFRAVAALREQSDETSGIAIHWARSRVEHLMDGLVEGVDPKSVREAVLDLALDFGLVTRYSSRVAVEDFPTAMQESRLAALRGVLPQGGTWNPLKRSAIGILFVLGCALLVARRGLGS